MNNVAIKVTHLTKVYKLYGEPTLEDAKEFYKFARSFFDGFCGISDIDKDELK